MTAERQGTRNEHRSRRLLETAGYAVPCANDSKPLPAAGASRKGGVSNLTLDAAAAESRMSVRTIAVSDLQLLRLSDAAAVARLSERTLRRALHSSRNPLRCYRFGHAVRITPGDLAAWLRAHAALPVVSTTVIERLSPIAQELIQSLNQPTPTTAGRRGDRTAKAQPTARPNNLRPEPPTPLDCGAESSVHVSTDPRSKEEPIPMHDTSTLTRFRAIPAPTARGGR